MMIDTTDRKILQATQAGLPLVSAPYAEIGDWLKLDESEIIGRLRALQDEGVIRRIAIAPNHYALGLLANGMSVWDVDDSEIDRLGAVVGALPFVTHCYERPRALPDWPYNLFAMIHGKDKSGVEDRRREIAAILGDACRASDILYSTRILKKTGMRIRKGG